MTTRWDHLWDATLQRDHVQDIASEVSSENLREFSFLPKRLLQFGKETQGQSGTKDCRVFASCSG